MRFYLGTSAGREAKNKTVVTLAKKDHLLTVAPMRSYGLQTIASLVTLLT